MGGDGAGAGAGVGVGVGLQPEIGRKHEVRILAGRSESRPGAGLVFVLTSI